MPTQDLYGDRYFGGRTTAERWWQFLLGTQIEREKRGDEKSRYA
jgi:hypothetical protein